jgi:hypothetical protein
MDKKNISIQITLEGIYGRTFELFKKNHPMDGRTNRSAFLELLRQTPEFQKIKDEVS